MSRNVDPQHSAVVSFGTIHGGTANNVIPDEVKLTGTVRTFDPHIRESMEPWMRRVIEHAAASLGCTADFYYRQDLPAVMNHPEAAALGMRAIEEIIGKEGIVIPVPSMGARILLFFRRRCRDAFSGWASAILILTQSIPGTALALRPTKGPFLSGPAFWPFQRVVVYYTVKEQILSS